MTDREAMQRALNALELVTDLTNHDDDVYAAIDALRERLAQPEQEPATKAGELKAMRDAFWKQPEQEPGFLGQLHKIFGGN